MNGIPRCRDAAGPRLCAVLFAAASSAVVADGKLVLAGTAQVDATRCDLVFVRLDASGTPDPGFGSSGRVLAGLAPVYLPGNFGHARMSDGRLLYVAHTTASGVTTVVGRRSADTSFNGSGHRQ